MKGGGVGISDWAISQKNRAERGGSRKIKLREKKNEKK